MGEPSSQQPAAYLKQLETAFPRVFDASTLREVDGGPMKITLTEDAKPFAITAARKIPFAWQEQVKKELDELERKGIIKEVEKPTECCHPIVVVAKKGLK